MGKKLSFFGSAFFYTVGVILAQGVNFLLSALIYPSIMDPGDFARIGMYALWVSVFGALIGLEAASSLNNARLAFGKGNLAHYTSSLIGIGMIMLAILVAVFLALQSVLVSFFDYPIEVLVAGLLQGFFSFCIVLIAQMYRVTNKPGQFVLWTSAVCVLRLVISVPLVLSMSQNQYLGDVYGSLLAYGIVGTAGIILMVKNGHSVGKKEYWKYCLPLTIPLVFHSLASLVLGQSDQYMLQRMVGFDKTAPYTLAYTISTLANAVWLAFNNAWSVWYFDKTDGEKHDEVRDLFKKYAGFVTLLTAGIMLVAPDLIHIVTMLPGKEAYTESVYLLPILMLGCYFAFLYTFPVAYETYKHKTKYIAVGTIAAAALNIGLNFYFIPRLGLQGAAISTLIAYAMLFVFHYMIAKFLIKGFQIRFFQLLLPALAMAGVVGLTYGIMDITALRWVLAAVFLVIAFLVFRKSKDIMME